MYWLPYKLITGHFFDDRLADVYSTKYHCIRVRQSNDDYAVFFMSDFERICFNYFKSTYVTMIRENIIFNQSVKKVSAQSYSYGYPLTSIYHRVRTKTWIRGIQTHEPLTIRCRRNTSGVNFTKQFVLNSTEAKQNCTVNVYLCRIYHFT